MDMDALEEFSGSNDHNLILKGKRTKRQRPSSPVGTAVTSSLSSGSRGGGSGTSGGGDGGGGYFSVPSPISSGEISSSKEEDEDLANCLILLAQGFGPRQAEEEKGKIEKLSSRKFTEMATTTAGKAGFYVYECKTCNRTFPSFQALGGHRASHKKSKVVAEEKIRSLPITQLPFDEEEGGGGGEEERQFIKISPPLSLQVASKSNTSTKSKVHECSICGSEFSSGQALGGHMRRHRAPPNTRIGMNMAEMNTNTNTTDQSRDESDDGQRNVLGLDLNLPAPPEDDHHRDSNFQFTAPNKHLVFSSAPALVDCHY